MSEEKRNPGSEISEAELAGVSGGVTAETVYAHVCNRCPGRSVKSTCTGGPEQLAEFINQNHRQEVHRPADCPFWIYNQ